MVNQLALGKQWFVTSRQGIEMMSVGITLGRKDFLVISKRNDIIVNGVSTLIVRCVDAGVTHFDAAQACKKLWSMAVGS